MCKKAAFTDDGFWHSGILKPAEFLKKNLSIEKFKKSCLAVTDTFPAKLQTPEKLHLFRELWDIL